MNWVLLFFIKRYWQFIPPYKRNKCIYKESCSRYVYRIAKEESFTKGIKALLHRYRNCRGNYQIIPNNNKIILITAGNEMLQEDDIRESLIK